MSRFKLGFEGQEQDIETDFDPRDIEYESLADSPLSPTASRAFNNAVDDSEALSRITSVLENSDTEDIPMSSRAVIQESMESIRARLLGGRESSLVAVEGFSNRRQLNLAIEQNKGILAKVWDAIVNFFKTIYNFIAGFFSRKKSQSDDSKTKIKKSEEEAKKLDVYLNESVKIDNNYTLKHEDSFIEAVKKKDSLSSEKPDVLPDNKVINTDVKPTVVEATAVVDEIKQTITEKKPLTFDTDKFSNFLPSKKNSITGPDGLSDTINYLHKDIDKLIKLIKDSSVGKVIATTITEEKFLSLTMEDFEKDFSNLTLCNGDIIIVTSTSSLIEKNDTKGKVEVSLKNDEILDFITKSKTELDKLDKRLEEVKNLLSTFITNLSRFTNKYKPDFDDENKEAKSNLQSIKNNTQIFNSFVRFITLYIDFLTKAHMEGVEFVINYQKTRTWIVANKTVMQPYVKFSDLAKLYKNDKNFIRDNFTKIRSDVKNGFFDGEFNEDYSQHTTSVGRTEMGKVFYSLFGVTTGTDFKAGFFCKVFNFYFFITGHFYSKELLESRPEFKEKNFVFVQSVESGTPGIFTLFWEFFLRFCKFYKIKQIRLLDRASGNDVWTRNGFTHPINKRSSDEDGHRTLNLY